MPPSNLRLHFFSGAGVFGAGEFHLAFVNLSKTRPISVASRLFFFKNPLRRFASSKTTAKFSKTPSRPRTRGAFSPSKNTKGKDSLFRPSRAGSSCRQPLVVPPSIPETNMDAPSWTSTPNSFASFLGRVEILAPESMIKKSEISSPSLFLKKTSAAGKISISLSSRNEIP